MAGATEVAADMPEHKIAGMGQLDMKANRAGRTLIKVERN